MADALRPSILPPFGNRASSISRRARANPLRRRTLAPCGAAFAALIVASSWSCGLRDDVPSTSFAVVFAEVSLVTGATTLPDGSRATVGLDLDHRLDDGTQPEGCFKSDGVAPDGSLGIDN